MKDEQQTKTPLFDAMVSLAESRKISFHTPGHKSGKGISTRFRQFVGPKVFSIDLTTLDEIDSLQQPVGVIKSAQALAASAYGADHSFFLINGTTGGNHAMILANCRPGDTVLVARNTHRSIIAGLIFSGVLPVFFSTEIDQKLKIQLNASFQGTRAIIDAYPHAKALILTSPNYHGITADLPKIISYAHQKGMKVLVDEAHGPHLHFHASLPPSAMSAGADLSVQSTHKIIGGMTQASMLHAKSGRIDIPSLRSVLNLMQTTSPSYILMASLDLARMQMATEGEKLLEKTIRLANESRQKINEIPGISCFGPSDLLEGEFGLSWEMDVTKLTISLEDLGLTGFQVSKILNHDYQIQVEMADLNHILLIVSIGDRQSDLDHLIESLRAISKKYAGIGKESICWKNIDFPILPEASRFTLREAFFDVKDFVPIEKAEGQISSDIVTIYPPGIPILVPGEVVSSATIKYIQKMLEMGATVDGLNEDQQLAVLKAS